MKQWEEAFEQLRSYVSLNGNANVPHSYVSPDGLKLGAWIGTQRTNKPQNILSQDRLERLEALPGWSWDPITEQWEEGFEQLRSYVNQHGNASVPQKYVTPDDFKLGSWISDKRKRKSKNLLSEDRIERLEALPLWSWDPITEQWEEAFGQLQSYVKQHGNARISNKYVTPDGFGLGNWVGHQRQNKSKNFLSQDRIECLEVLSGWVWEPLTEQWEEAFGQLQSYVKLNGNASVPQKYVTPDGIELGLWVSRQRKKKSKNFLSQDRIKHLETLPGWVWSFKKETE